MTRLPEPGRDADRWGEILNEFLSVSHHQDGSLRLFGSKVKNASEYVSLAAAVAEIGELCANLIVTDELAVEADLTIPANVHLIFLRCGALDIAPGVTVHIQSQPLAGLYPIFKGEGDVLFQDSQIGCVYPQWWGAVADYGLASTPTDNLAAFHKAIRSWSVDDDLALSNQGGRICVPNGKYYFSDTLHIEKGLHLQGGSVTARRNTVLAFPPDTTGIIVERVGDVWVGDRRVFVGTGPNGTSGAWSVIEGLFVTCTESKSSTSGHGIQLRDRATIRQCSVHRMGGDGVHVDTSQPVPVTLDDGTVVEVRLNANTFQLEHLWIYNCSGHGVYVNGAESNAGVGRSIDAGSNGGVGIFDGSFLGNCWIGCHTASNSQGYATDGASTYAAFFDCYAEMNQAPPDFTGQTTVHGGNIAGSGNAPQRFGYSHSRIVFKDSAVNDAGSGQEIKATLPSAAKSAVLMFQHTPIENGELVGGTAPWYLKRWPATNSFYANKWVISRQNTGRVPIWWTDDGHALGAGKLGFGHLADSPYYWRIKEGVTVPVSGEPTTFELPGRWLGDKSSTQVDVQATFVADDEEAIDSVDIQVVGIQVDGANNKLRVRLRNNGAASVAGTICARIVVDEGV